MPNSIGSSKSLTDTQNATVAKINDFDKEIKSECSCWLSHVNLRYFYSSAHGRSPTSLGTSCLPQLSIRFSCLCKGTFVRITFVPFWAEGRVILREDRQLLEDEIDAGSILRGQQPPEPGLPLSLWFVCILKCTPRTGVVLAWAEMLQSAQPAALVAECSSQGWYSSWDLLTTLK